MSSSKAGGAEVLTCPTSKQMAAPSLEVVFKARLDGVPGKPHGRSWSWVGRKVPSNPNQSMILLYYDSCHCFEYEWYHLMFTISKQGVCSEGAIQPPSVISEDSHVKGQLKRS